MEYPIGLREGLHQFWRDHFTVRARRQREQGLMLAHAEMAVRPHLSGCFAGMLTAAVTHPAMLMFLDQSRSVGPESRLAGKISGRGLGLHENLSREVLELHTLGVGGAYAQTDVRQLAELFSGLTLSASGGYRFAPRGPSRGARWGWAKATAVIRRGQNMCMRFWRRWRHNPIRPTTWRDSWRCISSPIGQIRGW